jgi:hypothetical protein
MFEGVDAGMGRYSTTGWVVCVARDLETCLVGFFNGYSKQFLVEWNIRRVWRACAFVPAC